MIGRGTFLAGLGAGMGAALGWPSRTRAAVDGDLDPARTAGRPELRVLLGRGTAEPAPGGFRFNGRLYRGSFTALDDGRIVNLIDLEAYLYSVVPREMGASWPAAALAAQAICARTYVLQRSNPNRAYDLVPSEADQVYDGVAAESALAEVAVDATAGTVLSFAGRFASVAYSSCCGGHTESAGEAWGGGGSFPYLEGVDCPWCHASPNFRWVTNLGYDAIDAGLATQLAALGALEGVAITSTDRSGRARGFELTATGGRTVVKGSVFRLAVGARVVRSLLILRLTQANATVTLEGGGLGHGVGLCQWGARGMALAGKSAGDIVTWYFPGTTLTHE